MILVDSFGWIEYFTDGSLADKYSKYLQEPLEVITPTIVVYEVYKKIKTERNEDEALLAVAQMKKTQIVPLDEIISLLTADISLKYSLPMADAIVYATAQVKESKVITSDSHFKDLKEVEFLE